MIARHKIYITSILYFRHKSMTKTETPERVSTELASLAAKKPCRCRLANPQGFILAGTSFEIRGADQALSPFPPSLQ